MEIYNFPWTNSSFLRPSTFGAQFEVSLNAFCRNFWANRPLENLLWFSLNFFKHCIELYWLDPQIYIKDWICIETNLKSDHQICKSYQGCLFAEIWWKKTGTKCNRIMLDHFSVLLLQNRYQAGKVLQIVLCFLDNWKWLKKNRK